MNWIKVKRLHDEAIIPDRANIGDAGLDLYSIEEKILPPGGRDLFKTGISVAIPEGFAGLITPRSGLAYKNGVTVLNTPGLIDSGYRGELGVILYNVGRPQGYPIHYVRKGDKIAQLVIIKTPYFSLCEVDELSETQRGKGGFGSSGD